MHADEVGTDLSLVGRLLTAQFPQWVGLSIERVEPAGTDRHLSDSPFPRSGKPSPHAAQARWPGLVGDGTRSVNLAADRVGRS